MNSITYVSNAGVLIKLKDKKILIDALCSSEIPIYKSTPDDVREKIIKGVEPFDNIDLMLITHKHSDHFDSKSVAEFLEYSTKAVLISTQEVISMVRMEGYQINPNQLIGLMPKGQDTDRIQVNGINIMAIPMVHDGKEYENVLNFAYLIDYGLSVLHLGDALPVAYNFASIGLQQHRIDWLIANFPYVAIPSVRQIVKDYINPKSIAVVHLPYEELDRFGWIKAAKKNYERVRVSFAPVEFFEEVGEKINF